MIRLATALSVFLLSLVLTSCRSIRSDNTELRRHAVNLPILTPEEVRDRPYKVIGEARGSVPLLSGEYFSYSERVEAAHQKLRLDGAEMEADALINVFCEEGQGTFKSDAIECYADAIQWEQSAGSRQ